MSLQVAIDRGLASLGEPIMKTIIWHLHSRGFFIESRNIDIALFYDHLYEIIGNAADNVLEEVYMNLKLQHSSANTNRGIAHGPRNNFLIQSTNSDDRSIIYKIQELVNSDGNTKEGNSE